jgi:hypothetical protein
MGPSTGSDLPLFVSSSTVSRPQFDHYTRSIDPELFQSPPHKRPENAHHDCSDDDSDGSSSMGTSSTVGYAASTPPTSSPPHLGSVLQKVMQEAHGSKQAACSKRAEEGQFLMNQRFQPYKRRQAPPLSSCALP